MNFVKLFTYIILALLICIICTSYGDAPSINGNNGIPYQAPNNKIDTALIEKMNDVSSKKKSIFNKFNNVDLSLPENEENDNKKLKLSLIRSITDKEDAHAVAQDSAKPRDDVYGRETRKTSPLIQRYIKEKSNLKNMMYFGNGLNKNGTKKDNSNRFSRKKEWAMLKDLLTDYRPSFSTMKRNAQSYHNDHKSRHSQSNYGKHFEMNELPIEIQAFAELTYDEAYDALYVLPRKHEYNWMIGKLDEIEFILPENDEILYELLNDGLNKYFNLRDSAGLSSEMISKFSRFFDQLSKQSSSSMERLIAANRERDHETLSTMEREADGVTNDARRLTRLTRLRRLQNENEKNESDTNMDGIISEQERNEYNLDKEVSSLNSTKLEQLKYAKQEMDNKISKEISDETNDVSSKTDIGKSEKAKEKRKYYNINGGLSDWYAMYHGYYSTGNSDEYWYIRRDKDEPCVQPKGCNVYPPMRVLHKSISISCNDIMTYLMPQIYDCINEYGFKKCPMIVDSGFFRIIFKVVNNIPQLLDKHNTNNNNNDEKEYLVLKMMQPKSKDNSRDYLRHIRESIMLYYLEREERRFIDKNGYLFKSLNEKRAFPFVRELGHCVYPTYMSVSRYYNMTLDDFVNSGYSQSLPIWKLLKMSIDIARGVELLHTLPGGGYHHTDITSDQFMVDSNLRIFINDFNRGKFGSFVFSEDYVDAGDLYYENHPKMLNNSVIPCWYYGHRSRGQYRAPEEHKRLPLNEKLDIFSAGLIIWQLFAGTSPFPDTTFDELVYIVHDTYQRPPMPSNMPYPVKDIIRQCLFQDPRLRPTATELKEKLLYVMKYIKQFTNGKGNVLAKDARKDRLWRDTEHPTLEMFGLSDKHAHKHV